MFDFEPLGGFSVCNFFFQIFQIRFCLLLVRKLWNGVIGFIVVIIKIIPDSKKRHFTVNDFSDRETFVFRHFGFLGDGFCLRQHFIHTLSSRTLSQPLLKLLLVNNLIVPRLPVRTGVDAHIGFANIADGTFNRSGGQVYHNFIPDIVVGCFLSGSTLFLFLICQIAVGLNHKVDILFHLRPFQGDFLVVRVMVKFQSLPVVVHKTPASVQKIVGVPTNAVLLCQCFGTEFAVRLGLVQCHNALLATCKPRTMLAQFILNFSL